MANRNGRRHSGYVKQRDRESWFELSRGFGADSTGFRVYLAMEQKADYRSGFVLYGSGLRSLARDIGLSLSTVKDAVDRLLDAGRILVIRENSGRRARQYGIVNFVEHELANLAGGEPNASNRDGNAAIGPFASGGSHANGSEDGTVPYGNSNAKRPRSDTQARDCVLESAHLQQEKEEINNREPRRVDDLAGSIVSAMSDRARDQPTVAQFPVNLRPKDSK